jgi:hypothetical protein
MEYSLCEYFQGCKKEDMKSNIMRLIRKWMALVINKKSIKFTEKLGFPMKNFTNKTVKDTALQNYNYTKCLCIQMVEKKFI